jgi:alkanesulfonate monooxygenase SsuD/methylene tetrahydromethanopterin reductase-like flavin-dependent oxidoreductase (luciferase family)
VERSWDYLGTGRARPFDGEFYRLRPPRTNPWGNRELRRPTIPIYVAAMGPRMLELCGERGQGWLGYFATPQLLDEFVRPRIAEGARRAGRDASQIELFVELVCSVSPDRELALARARRQVGFYAVHPISDRVVASYGLLDAVNELRSRLRHEGIAAFEHTDDRLVDVLSITGTPEEARQKLDEYSRYIDHVALHAPYVPPLTAEDAADAFGNILSTFGRRNGHVATSR